jgi:hypothetical protein
MNALVSKGRHLVLYFFAFALIFVIFSFYIADGKSQYAIEIAAAFMGGILTIIITGILLHKQTAVELERERNARIFEEKLNVYNKILEAIQSVLDEGTIDRKRKLEFQMLNLKLIQIAPQEVIGAFNLFADSFQKACKDDIITDQEIPELLIKLIDVCLQTRADLAPLDMPKENDKDLAGFKVAATATLKMFEIDSREEFAESCTQAENKYFEEISKFVEGRPELSQNPGKVGVSIKKSNKPIIWYYPITPTTNNNLIFHIDNLSEEAKNILKESKNANFNMKRSPLKIEDIPVERLKKILELA